MAKNGKQRPHSARNIRLATSVSLTFRTICSPLPPKTKPIPIASAPLSRACFHPARSSRLIGTLGAGKTRLVQAVAAAVGVPRANVTSPTFVLVNEYKTGRLPIYHFDTYRLKDDDEFLNLGPDEYFDSNGLTFVEWADRVADLLPADRLEISIDVTGETTRNFQIRGTTPPMEIARLTHSIRMRNVAISLREMNLLSRSESPTLFLPQLSAPSAPDLPSAAVSPAFRSPPLCTRPK